MGKAFYSRLSYSIGNEDWTTERAALRIKPSDRILAITASGDRPLNLLSSECAQLVAIDANPFQNALCDLKRVALAELDYDHYLAFIGVRPSSHRLETYKNLENKLESASAACWKKYQGKIEKGILYEGSLERFLNMSSFFVRSILGAKVDRLFSTSTIEEQQVFIENTWNEKAWKRALGLVVNPIFTRFFFKDPGLYTYGGSSLKLSHYIHDRLLHGLKQFPIKENILISLICYGKVFEEGFSPYLTYEGTTLIKKRCEKLTLKTQNATAFLESVEEESFDCFSLSDIASYMKKEAFHRLCYALFKAARPGARFCIRQLLTTYTLPEELTPYLQRDEELEAKLEREDRCCVYRFLVGRVIK